MYLPHRTVISLYITGTLTGQAPFDTAVTVKAVELQQSGFFFCFVLSLLEVQLQEVVPFGAFLCDVFF